MAPRSGQFRFSRFTLPSPETLEEEAVFPRELWGTAAFELSEAPAHLTSVIVRQPEGMLLLGTCGRCGGRMEGLIDMSGLRDEVRQEAGRSEMTDLEILRLPRFRARLADEIHASGAHLMDRFLGTHVRCDGGPETHSLPGHAEEFVRQARRRAAGRLRRGDSVRAELFLLMAPTKRMVTGYEFPPSEPGSRERSNAATAHKALLRSFFRARRSWPEAAVIVSEAWTTLSDAPMADYPSRSPERGEALVVTLATPTFARTSMAPIRREGSTVGEGPATLDEARQLVVGGRSRLLDGLFARSATVDPTEERRRRAGGEHQEMFSRALSAN